MHFVEEKIMILIKSFVTLSENYGHTLLWHVHNVMSTLRWLRCLHMNTN
jgi:hypothetical protein